MQKIKLYCNSIANAHLTKDIVMIPYILQKYFDYTTEILSNEIVDDLSDNKEFLEGLEITLLKSELDLKDKLLDTDILIIFGLYNWNFNAIQLFKQINPRGKIYLKLDANSYWMFNVSKDINSAVFDLLKQCTIISTESRRLQHLLNMLWNLNIKYIPNGYYNFINNDIVEFKEKENIIMFSGRVGSYEKRNELLLEAFKDIYNDILDWKIELVGPVTDEFLIYITNYFKLYPHLKDKVKLIGNLDKKELKNHYKKAKIFCMTSIIEACANVFSEAISNGCYIISTDVDGAIDIIDYGNYGKIIPNNDLEKLKDALLKACKNQTLLEVNCLEAQLYSKEELDWVKLCKKIDKLL